MQHALAALILAGGVSASHTDGGGDDGTAAFVWFWVVFVFLGLFLLIACGGAVGHYGGYHEVRESYWKPGGVWHSEVWVNQDGDHHHGAHHGHGDRDAPREGGVYERVGGSSEGYGPAPPERRDGYVQMPGAPSSYPPTPYRPLRLSTPGSEEGGFSAAAASILKAPRGA